MSFIPTRLLRLPLYVRIWLAVVLAVAVLTLLTGWVMRMTAEPPLREVLVRNAQGELIGQGKARLLQTVSHGHPMRGRPLFVSTRSAMHQHHARGLLWLGSAQTVVRHG